MEIKSEILNFYPETGSLEVKYYCDEVPEGLVFAIDLPIENGQWISEEELDSFIKFMCPISQIERLAHIRNTPVPQYLLNKIVNRS